MARNEQAGVLVSVVVCWVTYMWVSMRRRTFTFGLLADVQAANRPDGHRDGRIQYFRQATNHLKEAVDFFLARSCLSCILSLGDIVDGRDNEVTTDTDLQPVLGQFARMSVPVLHCIGNHCVKYTPRAKLLSLLGLHAPYYATDIAPGWRLLVLDTTDVRHDPMRHASLPAQLPQAVIRTTFCRHLAALLCDAALGAWRLGQGLSRRCRGARVLGGSLK